MAVVLVLKETENGYTSEILQSERSTDLEKALSQTAFSAIQTKINEFKKLHNLK